MPKAASSITHRGRSASPYHRSDQQSDPQPSSSRGLRAFLSNLIWGSKKSEDTPARHDSPPTSKSNTALSQPDASNTLQSSKSKEDEPFASDLDASSTSPAALQKSPRYARQTRLTQSQSLQTLNLSEVNSNANQNGLVNEFADYFAAKRDRGEPLTVQDMAHIFERAAHDSMLSPQGGQASEDLGRLKPPVSVRTVFDGLVSELTVFKAGLPMASPLQMRNTLQGRFGLSSSASMPSLNSNGLPRPSTNSSIVARRPRHLYLGPGQSTRSSRHRRNLAPEMLPSSARGPSFTPVTKRQRREEDDFAKDAPSTPSSATPLASKPSAAAGVSHQSPKHTPIGAFVKSGGLVGPQTPTAVLQKPEPKSIATPTRAANIMMDIIQSAEVEQPKIALADIISPYTATEQSTPSMKRARPRSTMTPGGKKSQKLVASKTPVAKTQLTIKERLEKGMPLEFWRQIHQATETEQVSPDLTQKDTLLLPVKATPTHSSEIVKESSAAYPEQNSQLPVDNQVPPAEPTTSQVLPKARLTHSLDSVATSAPQLAMPSSSQVVTSPPSPRSQALAVPLAKLPKYTFALELEAIVDHASSLPAKKAAMAVVDLPKFELLAN